VLIIGESINSTVRQVGEAISNRDEQFIVELARRQVVAGAGMLDVNVAVAEGDEAENLVWAARTIQSAVNVPLVLDSRQPDALEAALQVHQGRPIINSISGEERRLRQLLPLVAKHDCGVILLCLDDGGIPKTPPARCEVAKYLVDQMTGAGIDPERLYVDPLIMAVGSDWQAPRVALDTLRRLRDVLPSAHTVAGTSNVSFGMPQRSLLNRTFLAMAIAHGLEAFLVNVEDKAMMATLWAADALMGNDTYCSAYLDAYHAGRLAT